MSCRSIRDLALGLASWLLGCVAVAGSLEVRTPSAKLLETAPGQIVTASVVVANRGANADDFNEVITLPAGCIRVAPVDAPFRLEAGDQAVRVIAVSVPATMSSGKFTIRYRVSGRLDPSAGDDTELFVQVTSVDKLDLSVESRPDPVFAGEKYPLRAEVINRGNSPLAVRLTSKSSLGFEVKLSPMAFNLPAGETREITGEVKTDEKLPRRATNSVSLQVQATTAKGEVLTTRRSVMADVIPLINGDRDPHHRLPAQFRMMALMENGRDAQMQAELSGSGTLDEAGKNRLDFVLRGPDIDHNSTFGQRDEYGLSLHGEHWGIDLGDRVFELSPLTEKRTYGRGVGISYRDGDFSAGGFYMRTRHRSENTEEFGAYARKQFSPRVSFQANYLRKWGGTAFSARALPQNIFSIEGRYQHGKQLDLRLEYGMSYSDSGVVDYGYRIDARGQVGSLSYALEHAHAGANFYGYYNDTDTTHLSLSQPITKQLRATASVNRYAGNLEQNPERSQVVNRENSWQVGLRYDFTKKTDGTLQWRHTDREDILAPVAYNFTEDSIRVGVGHNFGKLQMRSFVDLGTMDNDLTGDTGTFQRYSVFAGYQPTARQRYSIYANYGPSAFSGSDEHSLNFGVSADWQLKENLSVNVSYARNEFDGLTGREQDQIMARAQYRFANGDEISLAGRWMHSNPRESDRDEAAVMLTFTRPLGLPVSRKTSIGSLNGRLAAEGRPIARAIVKAGEEYAVTDSAGNFSFASLKPGPRELQVVGDSLGPNLVMATAAPANVNVKSAKSTEIELSAVRAASVKVRVDRYVFGAGDQLTLVGGELGTFLELSQGTEKIVEQTDRLGSASFERLRAGAWKLRVSDENLPPHHVLETPEQGIELKPGQSGELTIRILPLKRKLQMIDGGVIR